MDIASSIALSRLVAQQRALDVTASNIANANTPGFHGERMVFSDWLAKQKTTPGNAQVPGTGTIAYTQDRATYRDPLPGPVTQTSNPLDISMAANAYFTVQTASGPRLTRAGHFGLSASGGIVDDSGDTLLDSTGKPMQVAPGDTGLILAADGTLSTLNGPIGKIGAVTPADPQKLKAEGALLLNAGQTQTTPVTTPKMIQGTLEGSNVQPTMELNDMMTSLREFQFASEFIQAESDRQQGAIDKITQKSA